MTPVAHDEDKDLATQINKSYDKSPCIMEHAKDLIAVDSAVKKRVSVYKSSSPSLPGHSNLDVHAGNGEDYDLVIATYATRTNDEVITVEPFYSKKCTLLLEPNFHLLRLETEHG